MPTKTKTTRKADSHRRKAPQAEVVSGLIGVRVVKMGRDSKLELRKHLEMPRELFSRLVNVSVRTIAEVETEKKKVVKLQRPYNEVSRLYDALTEIVDPSSIGEWFVTPNKAFDGLKPIEVIERGEIDRLWGMVYRLRSGMPD